MRLRTKIQIFASVTLLIVIFFINAAIFYLFQKISLDAEVDRVRGETNAIMEALAMNMESSISPNDLLKAYIPSNGMIRIVNEEEAVIQSNTKKTEYYELPAKFVTSETHDIYEGKDGIPFVVISIPFIWEDGNVVTIQVSEKLISQNDTMDTLFYVLLFASLIMIVPAIVGGFVLSRFLLKPIQALTEAMTENPIRGQWKKIKLSSKSKDEIYQMSSTYNDMIDRVQESFEKQQLFVSNASHELKTPISIIKSYAQLLKRWGKMKPEVFDEATNAIYQEAERMESMTQQLLGLARNEREENMNMESVYLPSLVQEVIRAFTITFKRNITITNLLKEQETISCDRGKMKQVLYILLDNALKYSKQDINIQLAETKAYVEIAVQDFGEGIAQEELNRIFDRFYRVDKARSRETGGTGLGLSIAKLIVQAHGGDISVDSKEGEGTTFTVKLLSY